MNELTKVFEGKQLRIIDQDGVPWFVAKDVCEFFGDSDHKRSISRLDEDVRSSFPVIDSMGRTQQATIVNEAGLYALLFTFSPEKARKDGGADVPPHIQQRITQLGRFRKWVTSEVLPSIRKTGGYLSPSVDFTDPDNIQRLLDSWKEDRKKLTMAEGRIDRLVHNNRTYSTTEIAKELGMRSAQELNAALSEKGIIYKDKRGVWMLYAEYASKGFQNIKQREKENATIYYAEWTGLGRDWLVGMFHKGEQ